MKENDIDILKDNNRIDLNKLKRYIMIVMNHKIREKGVSHHKLTYMNECTNQDF